MGWVKDKGGSKKFQFGGQVPAPPRVPGVMPQVPMYDEGGKVKEKEWLGHPDDLARINKTKQEILERKKRKEPKAKRSSKYSAKQLAALAKKHNKTVKEIKRLIDRGPKFGK